MTRGYTQSDGTIRWVKDNPTGHNLKRSVAPSKQLRRLERRQWKRFLKSTFSQPAIVTADEIFSYVRKGKTK